MKRTSWLKALVASLIVAAPLALWTSSASAGFLVAPVPNFPGAVTVGDSFTGTLTFPNNSDGMEATTPITVTSITLAPACAVNSSPGCPGGIDPGVFTLGPVGTGSGAFAGITFTITQTSPGIYTFVPSTPLPATTAGQTGSISYPVVTSKVPTVDVQPGTPGTQTNVVAMALFSSVGQVFPNNGFDVVTVNPAPATIATVATPQQVGFAQPFSDLATVTGVTGGPTPTGTVTFQLFGPATPPGFPTCAGPAIGTTAPIPLTSAGAITAAAGSGPFGLAGSLVPPGNYVFVAQYSGDRNYVGSTSACSDPSERVSVAKAPAAIATAASPQQVLPNVGFSDTATVTGVAGLPAPTGTVSFQLFGPTAPGFPTVCTGAPFDSAGPFPLVPTGPNAPTASSVGSGTFGLPPRPQALAGNYVFVATYSGDANFVGSTSSCIDPAERVTVNKVPPTIATVSSPKMVDVARLNGPQQPFADTATITGLGGLPAPTGTVSFQLFGPTPTGFPTVCTGAPFDSAGPFPLVATGLTTASVGSGNFGVPPRLPPLPGGYVFVASYSGDANYTPITSSCLDAAEQVTVNPQPTIAVVKTANPTTRPEPGGTFRFSVVITNTSNEPVTIVSVMDDKYGNLTSAANPLATNNTCLTAPGSVLAADPDGTGPQAGGSFPCAFDAVFLGNFTPVAARSQTDVVTAVAVDRDNNPASAFDDAVVTLTNVPPTIIVDKTASPLTRPEPGGTFRFSVVVTNTSFEPVTITSLTDDKYGDLNSAANPKATNSTCVGAIGQVLAPDPDGVGPRPGGSFSCAFDGVFLGNFTPVAARSQTDVVTSTAVDDDGTTATANDSAVVTLTDVPPTIVVDKTASPATRLEPGGTFRFSVVVTNTSFEPVTIRTLTDDKYGDLTSAANPKATNNTCLNAVGRLLAADPDGPGGQPGGSYTCAFDGTFFGSAGDPLTRSQTDVVTSTAVDDDGTTATDDDDATVNITNLAPTIQVDKTATPASRPEPGGAFTFNVVVTNISIETVTITSLLDDIYGDLNSTSNPKVTANTCAGGVGRQLAASGGAFRCSFTGNFTGDAGDPARSSQRDVVTAIAVDNSGSPATDDDDATVTLTDVVPTIVLTKTADPLSRPEPGGTFRFSVVITNPNTEAVTIRTLTDDKYGDLNAATNPKATNNTCVGAVGRVLPPDPDGTGPLPGGSYSCAFDGTFFGSASDPLTSSQRDVVTTTVTDNDNNTATDDDDATVTITNAVPTVEVVKTASPETRPAPGGAFTFNVVVTNTSTEVVTITALTDDVYGNIATQGTCTSAIGTVLDPNETYSCSFTGNFTGASGSQKDVVTVTVVDEENTSATDTDDATVTITPGVVVSQNTTNQPSTTPSAPASNVTRNITTTTTTNSTALPKTGASVADLVALAVGLVVLGGVLVLVGARWAPTIPTLSTAGLGGVLATEIGRRRSRWFPNRTT